MKLSIFSFVFLFLYACAAPSAQRGKSEASAKNSAQTNPSMNPNLEVATFGAGCFWCVEAIFQQLQGVEKVVSGYSGGHVKKPTYKAVCEGTTGHAEVVQVYFDPSKISFDELLTVFWATHDPTTLNRQGADVGTQYRSVIFYHNEAQRQAAEASRLKAQADFVDPIVTEIRPFGEFYEAEDYHQDYYNLNGGKNPYCNNVISPKVAKFKKAFSSKLKAE
jgi:peptide-methionine (S)-S-oxide reductase